MSHGVVAKEGSIIDASFVDVPRQRNSREENADIKKDAVPLEFGKNQSKLSQKDTDARWMTKNNERHYGYKNHVNADAKTKIVTTYSVSSAAPHDSTELESLVNEEDTVLYADSAYRSKKIEAYLEDKKCKSHVHEKGYRNNPLDIQQKMTNSIKSKIRARVEHIFGFMTNSMNDALRMRSIGKERIVSTIGFLNLTCNLFRYEQLVRVQKVEKM
jgi:IS5 family transposase